MPRDERGTYEYQDDFMRFHVATYEKRPFINGAMAWILQDFKVRPDWGGGNPQPQPPWNQKGLVDQYGKHKPAFSLTARMYHRVRPLGRSTR